MINEKIAPRALTSAERQKRAAGDYDSFADYLIFCHACSHLLRTNMYIQSAEVALEKLVNEGAACPRCGSKKLMLGYPLNTRTGFVRF